MITMMTVFRPFQRDEIILVLNDKGILVNETEGYRINGNIPWEISNVDRFIDEMGWNILETIYLED